MRKLVYPLGSLKFKLFIRTVLSRQFVTLWLLFLIFLTIFLYELTFIVIERIISHPFESKFISTSSALFLIFLMISLVVVFYVVFVGSRFQSTDFSYSKVCHLPIARSKFYGAEVLLTMLDIWCLLPIPIMLAIAYGLQLSSDISTLIVAIVIFTSYLLFLGTVNQSIRYCLQYIFRLDGGHILKASAFVLSFLGSATLVFPIRLLQSDPTAILDFLGEALYQNNLYLSPIGLVADGLALLSSHDFARILYLHIPLLSLYSCLILMMGYILFVLNLRAENRLDSHVETKRRNSNFLFKIDRFFEPFARNSWQSKTLLFKELLYLLRSPRIALVGMFGVIGVLIMMRGFSQSAPLDTLMMLMLTTMFLQSEIGYVFSFDEEACKFYFFSPIKVEEILWSKNLSLLVLLLLFQAFVCCIGRWQASGVFTFAFIQGFFLMVLYIYFSNAIVLNYLSLTNPRPVGYNEIFGRSFQNAPVVLISWLLTSSPLAIVTLLGKDIRFLAASLSVSAFLLFRVSIKRLSAKVTDWQEHFTSTISK